MVALLLPIHNGGKGPQRFEAIQVYGVIKEGGLNK